MTPRAALDATLAGIRNQGAAYALLHSVEALAALHGPHDPWHMARERRRGRHAQRALQAWAEDRGLRVTIPALERRRAQRAAMHMEAARMFAAAGATR